MNALIPASVLIFGKFLQIQSSPSLLKDIPLFWKMKNFFNLWEDEESDSF